MPKKKKSAKKAPPKAAKTKLKKAVKAVKAVKAEKTEAKVAKKAKKTPSVKPAGKPIVKADAVKPEKKPIKKVGKPSPAAKDEARPAGEKAKDESKKLKKKIEKEPRENIDLIEETDEFGGEESAVEVAVVAVEVKEILEEEVVLTDAEGRRYCRVRDCDQIAVVEGYCRYHYLLFWKKIQVRKKILAEGKLERYIEELTSRYPDKYLEMLKKDLKTEKDFLSAIQELEIDESGGEGDFEDESQSYIDEVRGMSETGTAREEEDF